jgi:cell division transport system permease protein
MNREAGTVMKISSVEYSFVDALKSLKRNRSLSAASVATVAATLFIFGVFILISTNLNQVMRGVESQLQVRIALNDDITNDQQKSIESTIKDVKGVAKVDYETKAQALANFKEQMGENNKDFLTGLDKSNPLPNTYIVNVDKPDIISDVVKQVKDLPGIYEIQDGREVVKTVTAITNTIKWVGAIIMFILVAVSFFLIGNTIKLTVFSRRREIGIMKYIGATDWFIRTPFIIEGIILGVFGAIVSNLALYGLYKLVVNKMGLTFAFIKFIAPSYVLGTMMWEFILFGVIIGAASSIFAVRKFLAV